MYDSSYHEPGRMASAFPPHGEGGALQPCVNRCRFRIYNCHRSCVGIFCKSERHSLRRQARLRSWCCWIYALYTCAYPSVSRYSRLALHFRQPLEIISYGVRCKRFPHGHETTRRPLGPLVSRRAPCQHCLDATCTNCMTAAPRGYVCRCGERMTTIKLGSPTSVMYACPDGT